MKRKILVIAAVAIFTVCVSVSRAMAVPQPTEEVRSMMNKVLRLLNDETMPDAIRQQKLKTAILYVIDRDEMSKRALGIHFASNKDRLNEFGPLFLELIEKAYFSRLNAMKGAVIDFTGEDVNEGYAIVHSRIFAQGKDELFVDYRMRLSEGRWRIYDIYISSPFNMSLVSSYRAQFNRLLSKMSFDEVLQRLREKINTKDGRLD
ncbi:MAG: hypothetical protein A2934_05875 [Candidatus Sungbacteria bacterium RIFCSPLOWO2_01_FULL_47_10]|uniref:ABC transporter substrate-binding protein n=1 Tax=Candidatus Sungbacteria bacterium RIFCSPLOWO2_01_FULL_47_10 TaxID=1802276 RepID=A0A1G2L7Q9_9BACT|nr:MAG: hypothetical protein A2934_05875 [Candidatus Sungbacteria bacterium RIFCSPLOWO2_01_FULL_47_10]